MTNDNDIENDDDNNIENDDDDNNNNIEIITKTTLATLKSNTVLPHCDQVVDTCLYKGSRDNMSIILMTLDAAPQVSQEAIDQEKELDSRLEAKIQVGVFAEARPLHVSMSRVSYYGEA